MFSLSPVPIWVLVLAGLHASSCKALAFLFFPIFLPYVTAECNCCDSSHIPLIPPCCQYPKPGLSVNTYPAIFLPFCRSSPSFLMAHLLLRISLFSLSYIYCRIDLWGMMWLSNTHVIPLGQSPNSLCTYDDMVV